MSDGLSQFIEIQKDTKPGHNGLSLSMHYALWVLVLVVVIYHVWKMLKGEGFQVTTAGYLGARAGCLDTPGQEKCGSSGEGFWSSRAVGPEVGTNPALEAYYADAVKQPEAEGFKSRKDMMSVGKHAEGALEQIARNQA